MACAVQNLALMAKSLGVAGYWSSWQAVARDAPEMADFLGMPSGCKCLGVYIAGMPPADAQTRAGSRQAWQSKVVWRV